MQDTIIVYTYRYFWKNTDGKLCVKFLTETQEGHKAFQESILKDNSVISCFREYVSEVNFAYLGFTEEVKLQKKESE